VVGVSRHAPRFTDADLPDPVCDYCGTTIDEDTDQQCPALDDGRCQP